MNGGPKPGMSCVSCGSLERGGGIEYKKEEDGARTYSITMCRDCLDNPHRIDVREIIKNLEKNNFGEPKDIKLVEKSLELFKKGKMKFRKELDGKVTYYK